jgi:uncharacterized protein YueI
MKNKIKKLIFLLVFLICYNATTVFAIDKLGRLFTLPNERAQVDKWRILEPKPPELPVFSSDSKKNTEQKKLETPNFITFNGIVLRHGRQPIIWINGSINNELQGFGIDESAIRNTDLPIFLHELTEGENPQIAWAKEAIYVKPAQMLDTKNRTVIEKYAQESMAKAEVSHTEKMETEEEILAVDTEQPVVTEEKPSIFGKIKSFWKD